jgi:ABC-type phosphate transport system permease subunit
LLALLMVAREAYPTLFAATGLWGLLIADPWEPLSQPASLGVRHAWLSTLAVTSIALAAAAPLGFGIGIFIAEIAPPAIKKMLQLTRHIVA